MFISHLNAKSVFGLIMFLLMMSAIVSSVPAATFTVTKTTDTNDKVCNSDCSLREAITAANLTATDDVIEFNPTVFVSGRTITLAGGELIIADEGGALEIKGTGALTISGNNNSRVLFVNSATVTISGVTLTNGNGVGMISGAGGSIYNSQGILTVNNSYIAFNSGAIGGGIYNGGTLNLIGSSISSNKATDQSSGSGGGVYNSGTMRVNSSTINFNTSLTDGGGINNDSGNLSIINTTISNNASANSHNGGGIYNNSGIVDLVKVIINNNSAKGVGGGIGNFGSNGLITVTDSTIRSNGADSGGGVSNTNGSTINLTNSTVSENGAINVGGIYNSNAVTNLMNTTIARNAVSVSVGGILNENAGIINSHNSLIGNNTVTPPYNGGGVIIKTPSDFKGILTSQGYNLIESINEITINGTTTGNILGQDPQISPPGVNGAVLNIIGLLATSPAIDAADPDNFPAADQRGVPRPQDGDLNGSSLPDIGAYERKVTTFTVTKTNDTNDGSCNTDCSLREAFAAMVASNAPDKVVTFDSVIFAEPQTVNVTTGQINTPDNAVFAIKGTGANLLTISGNYTSRMLAFGQGSTVAVSNLKITKSIGTGILYYSSTLTINDSIISDNREGGFYGGILIINNSIITGNVSPDNGGAIYSGRLIMNNSIVSNNKSARYGGGLYVGSGSIINNSIITDNASISNTENSFYGGGGIYASSNIVTILNSTVSNNKTDGFGGGVYNNDRTYIFNSTISNNSSISGGGLYNSFHGLLNISNSTISGNTSTVDGGGIFNIGSGSTAALNLTNTTVANNSAARDGGGILSTITSGAKSYSRNSIIGDNTAINTGADFKGELISQGYNLIENITGAIISGESSTNILGKDPMLDPVLRNNGGSTLTHALLSGSPAINAGNNTNAPATDQRGFARIVSGTIDIGSFEVASAKSRKRVRIVF